MWADTEIENFIFGNFVSKIKNKISVQLHFVFDDWMIQIKTATIYINLTFLHFCIATVSSSYVPGPIPDSRSRHAPLYGRLVSEEHLPAAHRDVHQVKTRIINLNWQFSLIISSLTLISDPSVPHHHQQIYGRCRHEFQHIFEIHRSLLWGN